MVHIPFTFNLSFSFHRQHWFNPFFCLVSLHLPQMADSRKSASITAKRKPKRRGGSATIATPDAAAARKAKRDTVRAADTVPWVVAALQHPGAPSPTALMALLSNELLVPSVPAATSGAAAAAAAAAGGSGGWDIRFAAGTLALGAVQTKPFNKSGSSKRTCVDGELNAQLLHLHHNCFAAPEPDERQPPLLLADLPPDTPQAPSDVAHSLLCYHACARGGDIGKKDIAKMFMPFWLQRSGCFAPNRADGAASQCDLLPPAPPASGEVLHLQLPQPSSDTRSPSEHTRMAICEQFSAMAFRFVAGDGDFRSSAPQGRVTLVCILGTGDESDSSTTDTAQPVDRRPSSPEDTLDAESSSSFSDTDAGSCSSEQSSTLPCPELVMAELPSSAAFVVPGAPRPKLLHTHSSDTGTHKKRQARAMARSLASLAARGVIPPLHRGLLLGLVSPADVPAPAPIVLPGSGTAGSSDGKARKRTGGSSPGSASRSAAGGGYTGSRLRATARLAASMLLRPCDQQPAQMLQAVSKPFICKTVLSNDDIACALSTVDLQAEPPLHWAATPPWQRPPFQCAFASAEGTDPSDLNRLPAYGYTSWTAADAKLCLAAQLGLRMGGTAPRPEGGALHPMPTAPPAVFTVPLPNAAAADVPLGMHAFQDLLESVSPPSTPAGGGSPSGLSPTVGSGLAEEQAHASDASATRKRGREPASLGLLSPAAVPLPPLSYFGEDDGGSVSSDADDIWQEQLDDAGGAAAACSDNPWYSGIPQTRGGLTAPPSCPPVSVHAACESHLLCFVF